MKTNCKNCQKKLIKKGNTFCSMNCSAQFSNAARKALKIKKEYNCSKCYKPIKRRSTTGICKECNLIEIDFTLEEVKYHNHIAAAWALVRSRARNVLKRESRMSCEVCGYSRHIEACHIIDITQFPLDTKLSIVNSLSNLKSLCPNHHWEFDKFAWGVPPSRPIV